MTASWGGICCSQPPCVTVSLRAATYTHSNLTARKAFTISIPSEEYIRHADYFGMVSGRDADKFSTAGLTPVKAEFVDAPYVKEFPLVLECKLVHRFELGVHTQFVGEIMDVKADEAVLDSGGLPDIKKLNPLVFAPGAQAYYGVGAFLGQAFSLGGKL